MVRFSRVPSFSFPNYAARLPDHYYKYAQELKKPSARVHDKEITGDLLDLKWNDKIKRVERVRDMPIPVIYPKQADEGLWGGEGIVKGYIKPRKYFQAGWPRPKTWFPELKKVVLYSEILDKHFTFIVTARTLELVDKFNGLDSYILRTPVQDLKSMLGLALRRRMLLNLARDQFKTPQIAAEMKQKYSDCIIPEEEALWIGLNLGQAIEKQKIETAKNNSKIPLKYEYAKQLIANLEDKKNNMPEPEPDKSIFEIFKSKLGF